MTTKKNFAEYGHFKRVTDPEIIKEIRKIDIDCENIPQDKFNRLCELLEIDNDF